MKKTYEVLCSPLGERVRVDTPVCLFTPFVTSAVDGISDVGVLGKFDYSIQLLFVVSFSKVPDDLGVLRCAVRAITVDKKASLYRTLIESTEFLRHKINDDEEFPLHERDVMDLGRMFTFWT